VNFGHKKNEFWTKKSKILGKNFAKTHSKKKKMKKKALILE